MGAATGELATCELLDFTAATGSTACDVLDLTVPSGAWDELDLTAVGCLRPTLPADCFLPGDWGPADSFLVEGRTPALSLESTAGGDGSCTRHFR